MTVDFDETFRRLIGHEGEYVNNPKDPGGETKFGISKRSYSNVDIKNLTLEQAKVIWRRDFWETLTDSIDPSIRFQAFDFAGNSGMQTAIRKLQVAIGVADDGHWGPLSLNACRAMDKNDVLMRYLAERLDFMRKLSTWSEFSSGWAGRIAQNLRYAAKDN